MAHKNRNMAPRQEGGQVTQRQVQVQQWSGPLPSPIDLKGYEEICPGAADRILSMAEKQNNHRIELETKVIRAQIGQGTSGQIFGFLIGLATVLGGVFCVLQNHEAAETTIVVSGAASVASVFVYGKKQQQKELKEKNPEA